MSDETVITVRDVMRTELVMIDGIATVAEALRTMREKRTSVLLVNRRHDGDEIGMVLVSHIARQVLSRNRAAERVNVYEIMEKPVVTVDPNMHIRYCARLFADYDLVRAPVVEGRQVIGIVSPVNLVLDGMASLL